MTSPEVAADRCLYLHTEFGEGVSKRGRVMAIYGVFKTAAAAILNLLSVSVSVM